MEKVDFDKTIPRFTRDAPYQVDICWCSLEDWFETKGNHRKIEINPDFQRGHVWTEEQQIKFVQYKLRGGKAATELYWNSPGYSQGENNPLQLVDGKQRLTAVRRFLNNEIPAFGYLYKQYDRFPRLNVCFRFYINDLKTKAEVLQWYLDLNTGGVVHTKGEIQKVRKMLFTERNK